MRLTLALTGLLSVAALAEGLPMKRPGPPPQIATLARVEAALPALAKFTQDAMASTGVPGISVAVVFEGKVVYLAGFGVRAVGRPETVDPDTVFQIASLSKPIASTVVASLVQSGTVKWDDPVVKYDPGFALADPWVTAHVSLADLFSHRSGLPDHAGDLLEDLGYPREEVLHRLRYEPLAPFRSTYAYTNFGLTEAAVAAASAAGKPWETLCQEKVYGPLGMTSTSSRFADYQSRPDRALLHVRVGDHWEARYVRQPDAQAPAGGVSSSARDMAQWMMLQLGEESSRGGGAVLPLDRKRGTSDETHVPHILSSPPMSFYGLGWGVGVDGEGRTHLTHSGAFASGAGTCVNLVPGDHLGIVALSNGMPIGVPEAVCDEFLERVLTGRVQRDWLGLREMQFKQILYSTPAKYTQPPVQPRPASGSYVGRYRNDFYGQATVTESGGKLTLKLGPQGMSAFGLTHYDGEVFVYETRGENASGLTAVTFTGTGMTIEALDAEHLGTFVKEP